ncbi:MAG: glycine cleavage T C-terminal barrel domain-containing protein [Deltaproteobacteria bacterium]|nr:glycine cleavage T C-terminal barrel domain-containing protein [Deltaproteobacteria bacterium]
MTMDERAQREAHQLRTAVGVWRHSDRLIVVRGDERLDWMSGMITQECKSMRAGESRYAAAVHEKGKLFGDLFIHCANDEIYVVAPEQTAQQLVEHFESHIIMEDVEVTLDPMLWVVTAQGPASEGLENTGSYLADRLGRGGRDWIVRDEASADALVQTLVSLGATAVSEEGRELARIEAGIPRFGVDFGTTNYVQEADITRRAVSFNKGCYVGQEVVCRLEMRGHVRRQLVAFVMDGAPPPPGTSLDQETGTITSSAFSQELGKTVGLAMVKWDIAKERKDISLAGVVGTLVERPIQ